jgi:transcriptional regulator with XRE-family HTH domain
MAHGPPPLSAVIGAELRTLREAGGRRQEQLAAEARRLGLRWTRATVAAIELGRRQLSIEELLLLPELLGRAGAGWGYEVSDLFPDNDRLVLLTGVVTAPSSAVRARFASRDDADDGSRLKAAEFRPPPQGPPTTLPRDWLLSALNVKSLEDVPQSFWREVALEAAGDAERKAAVSIGVAPIALALVARRRWRRSLTAERDRKVADATNPTSKLNPAAEPDPKWPRRLQAIRGHITRALVEELGPLLQGVSSSRKRRKR